METAPPNTSIDSLFNSDASDDCRVGTVINETSLIQPQQPPENGDAYGPRSLSPHPELLDDTGSGEIDRGYTGVFEGPEKTLEVVFRKVNTDGSVEPTPAGERVGLRRLSRHDLDNVCKRAMCTIISCVSNQYLDAYVLSESSLFVYSYMLVLKTCGTTTLLRCISVLIDLGRRLGLEIDWVGYSRKNFNFPCDQSFPHQSFHQELEYLYSHRKLCERLDGNGYTLGPVNGDHWFVFVADHTIRSQTLELDIDRVLNLMMFDIDEEVAKIFKYDEYARRDGETKEEETIRISKEQTQAAGIEALCPGAIIDPRAFEPCGYSMNAILFRSYSTIHITPESGSSYASFETNQRAASYTSLINNVVRTFKPKRFVMTILADEGGLKQMKEIPFQESGQIVVPPCPMKDSAPVKFSVPMVYKNRSVASIKVEDDCCCMMGNWVLEEDKDIRTSRNRGMSFA